MLAVVLREMVPSSHGHGYADTSTAAFLVGFVLLVVDAVISRRIVPPTASHFSSIRTARADTSFRRIGGESSDR
jgi:ZIP family zinc transporter